MLLSVAYVSKKWVMKASLFGQLRRQYHKGVGKTEATSFCDIEYDENDRDDIDGIVLDTY